MADSMHVPDAVNQITTPNTASFPLDLTVETPWRTDTPHNAKNHPLQCGFHQDMFPWDCDCGVFDRLRKQTGDIPT